MIKIENTRVVGLEPTIRGMRNPMNSWAKSDSYYQTTTDGIDEYVAGDADLDLMHRLASGGSDDRKFMRMIAVYADITAPLYWWKEYDTYKVGTVANSCSTMHKIAAKEFTLDDFSHEQLSNERVFFGFESPYGEGTIENTTTSIEVLSGVIGFLNSYRDLYNETKDKRYWWQMIQLLPTSYNQRRTVSLNYEVLRNQYPARKHHKLDEWHDYCHWIEKLPYSELITGERNEEK